MDDVALFETGRVFFNRPWDDDRRVPAQPERLGFAVVGRLGPRDLAGNANYGDVSTATAIWRTLADALEIGDSRLVAASPPGFHPGRAARVTVKGIPIGYVGEIHPLTARAYDLEERVAAGELDLGPLTAPPASWQFVEPSVYPPVVFDLAFDTSDSLPAADLLNAVSTAAPDVIESAFVFDEYRGPGMAPGRKGLAIRFSLRARDRTLSSGDIDQHRQMIIAAAEAIGAGLRKS